jgi:dihydrofolate synthase/folylpolyglutamate synthase
MNYDESVRALLSLGRELASPRHARTQKFGLEAISTLAGGLGNPHLKIPCAHIAGTNGKGSTAAMLESILRASGLRTGLYTSPHLERINERIRIAGEDISDEAFAAAWTHVQIAIESLMASGALATHPSFFECITAISFTAFADAKIEFAVYEVGLGGRFDATNIVQPEVAILTPIDFDHENFLGHAIEEIATEKAGIIKPGVPVVSAPQRPEARVVFQKRAAELEVPLIEVTSAWRVSEISSAQGFHRATATASDSGDSLSIAPALPGRFQIDNALAAATAARILRAKEFFIPNDAIERGISSVHWPGRLERLRQNPSVYLDGAHNPAGARELLKFWQQDLRGVRIILVFGVMRDKAVDEIAGTLFPHAGTVILTQPHQPRAISADLLAEMVGDLADNLHLVSDPGQALDHAIEIASPNDAIFVTGSLFLVGDLRAYFREPARTPTAQHTPVPSP